MTADGDFPSDGNEHDPDAADDWDQAFAMELIGRTLLVGLTYLDHDGTVTDRKQVFGRVDVVDAMTGIFIRQETDGTLFTIAPILEAIEHARPGLYQLSDSDAVVEDPDFTALLTVTAPLKS